jgi:endonuclease/exonuclease/phosphatase family metal-dependent hydrolase
MDNKKSQEKKWSLRFALVLTTIMSSLIIKYMSQKPAYPILEKPSYDKNTSFSVLSANVGNLSLGCKNVLYKLCYKDVEERIATNIEYLSPDIIALQEVLAPWMCEEINEKSRHKVCSEHQPIPQIRRLVGDGYTIVCNSRNQFECIAVKEEFGEIIGCPIGEICNDARTAQEIEGCDNGFTISAATIKTRRTSTSFDIVNFHPQSTSPKCREMMISTALYGSENASPIAHEKNILLLGDFNLDPWRDQDDSVETWNNFMKNGWSQTKLNYHSGIVENDPPYFTSFLFYKPRTLDFVVSNFAEGVCQILGESPNTQRLDGGKGTDHRALFGVLKLKP